MNQSNLKALQSQLTLYRYLADYVTNAAPQLMTSDVERLQDILAYKLLLVKCREIAKQQVVAVKRERLQKQLAELENQKMTRQVIAFPDLKFYPVGALITLAEDIQAVAKSMNPALEAHGVVKPYDHENGCKACMLIGLPNCTAYFPCYPDIREDKDTVYLCPQPEEKPE